MTTKQLFQMANKAQPALVHELTQEFKAYYGTPATWHPEIIREFRAQLWAIVREQAQNLVESWNLALEFGE